jgi:hypothetical protein
VLEPGVGAEQRGGDVDGKAGNGNSGWERDGMGTGGWS